MPFIESLSNTFGGSTVQLLATASLAYFALLWLSIIIWVTRDAISRSPSLLFQTFAILLNLAVPFLGVLLYLIIRPDKTYTERYYEEMEHKILSESAEGEITHCPQCQNPANKEHLFCHHCGKKLKTTCIKCKLPFPIEWPHCPYCGKKRLVKKEEKEKELEASEEKEVEEEETNGKESK